MDATMKRADGVSKREGDCGPNLSLSDRSFLLLQGPQSGFFKLLAKQLRNVGAQVNINEAII